MDGGSDGTASRASSVRKPAAPGNRDTIWVSDGLQRPHKHEKASKPCLIYMHSNASFIRPLPLSRTREDALPSCLPPHFLCLSLSLSQWLHTAHFVKKAGQQVGHAGKVARAAAPKEKRGRSSETCRAVGDGGNSAAMHGDWQSQRHTCPMVHLPPAHPAARQTQSGNGPGRLRAIALSLSFSEYACIAHAAMHACAVALSLSLCVSLLIGRTRRQAVPRQNTHAVGPSVWPHRAQCAPKGRVQSRKASSRRRASSVTSAWPR
jgi:hypothetical protein